MNGAPKIRTPTVYRLAVSRHLPVFRISNHGKLLYGKLIFNKKIYLS